MGPQSKNNNKPHLLSPNSLRQLFSGMPRRGLTMQVHVPLTWQKHWVELQRQVKTGFAQLINTSRELQRAVRTYESRMER